MNNSIDLILWDLDRTLCLHNLIFHQDAPIAVGDAAIEMGATEEAYEIAKTSYTGQRRSVIAVAERFNLDPDELFQIYYKHLKDNFLTPNRKLIEAFAVSPYQNGILTNASRLWIERALSKLELIGYFNDDYLFGYDERKQHKKIDGRDVLKKLVEGQGYNCKNVMVVDDATKNLSIPKELGMQTVLITNGEEYQSCDWVDQYHNIPLDVLRSISLKRAV